MSTPIGYLPNGNGSNLPSSSNNNNGFINGAHGHGHNNAFTYGAPIAPLALGINQPLFTSAPAGTADGAPSHPLYNGQMNQLPFFQQPLPLPSLASPHGMAMAALPSPLPPPPLSRPPSNQPRLSSSSSGGSNTNGHGHADARNGSSSSKSSTNGRGSSNGSSKKKTVAHHSSDESDDKDNSSVDSSVDGDDGDTDAERDAYLRTIMPFKALSDVMLTRKMAEHLPTGEVHRAVALVREALLKLKPVKLNGKTQGRLEWSLPPAESRPLPSLLSTSAATNLTQATPTRTKRHTRVLPLKCWNLTDLSFKAGDASSPSPLPAYSASKHLFFIELINTCHDTGASTNGVDWSHGNGNGNGRTQEKKKGGRTRVPGLRPKGEQESGQQSVTLTGRLKSGGGEEVGHIQFSSTALRYQFPLSQLFTDMPQGAPPSTSSSSRSAMDSDDDGDERREKSSKEAAADRRSTTPTDLPEPWLLVDIVNMSGDESSLNPLLKVKPLFGYGRIDFNFVLRQAGEFAIRVSLEVDDAYFHNGNEEKIIRALLSPQQQQPQTPSTPASAASRAMSPSVDTLFLPACGLPLPAAITMLRQSLDMSAYFVYDSPTAKRQRRFAASVVMPLEMPRGGLAAMLERKTSRDTTTSTPSTRGVLLGGASASVTNGGSSSSSSSSNGHHKRPSSSSSSNAPLRDRIVFGPPSTMNGSPPLPPASAGRATATANAMSTPAGAIMFNGHASQQQPLPFALDDSSSSSIGSLGSPLLHGDPVFASSRITTLPPSSSSETIDDPMDSLVDGDALPSFMTAPPHVIPPPPPPPPPPTVTPSVPVGAQSPTPLGHKRGLDNDDQSILKRGRVGATASTSVPQGIISFHPPDAPSFALPSLTNANNTRLPFGGFVPPTTNGAPGPILFRSTAPAGPHGYQRQTAAPGLLFPSLPGSSSSGSSFAPMSPSPFGLTSNGIAMRSSSANQLTPFSPMMTHSPMMPTGALSMLQSLSAPLSGMAPIAAMPPATPISPPSRAPPIRAKRALGHRAGGTGTTPTSPQSPNSEADHFLSLPADEPSSTTTATATATAATNGGTSTVVMTPLPAVTSPSAMFMLSSPVNDSPPGLEPQLTIGGNSPPHSTTTIATTATNSKSNSVVAAANGSTGEHKDEHRSIDVKRESAMDERNDATTSDDRQVAIIGHKQSPHPHTAMKQEQAAAAASALMARLPHGGAHVPGDATGQVISLLQKLYLDSAQPLGGARMLPIGTDPTSPNGSSVTTSPPSGPLPPGLAGPDDNAPQQLISTDGRTITLICAQGVWPENTSVYFHFGSKASTLAAGQIDPYKRNQRVFFIPPIPDKVWKSAVEYVRSCSHRFLAITPYITADVVVSSEMEARHPVVGYYTYPQSIPVPTDPSKKDDNNEREDDDDDEDRDRDKDQEKEDAERRLTRQGDTGSMAGIVITVQQKFFIPYNRLHALLLYTNHDCPINMDSPSATYLARHLVFGMQQLIQHYLDKKLAAMSPSPDQWHAFVASILPHSKLRDARAPAYEGPTSPKSPVHPPHERRRSKIPGEVEVDMSVEDLAVFVRKVLTDRSMDALTNRSWHVVDAHGLTLAHYLAAYGQFSLCALAGNHGADLLFVSPLSPLFSSATTTSAVGETNNTTSSVAAGAPVTPLSLLSLVKLQHMGLATRAIMHALPTNTNTITPMDTSTSLSTAPLAVAPLVIAPSAIPAPPPAQPPSSSTSTSDAMEVETLHVHAPKSAAPVPLPAPGVWSPIEKHHDDTNTHTDGDHMMLDGVEMTRIRFNDGDINMMDKNNHKSNDTSGYTALTDKSKGSVFITIGGGELGSAQPEPMAVNGRPLLSPEPKSQVSTAVSEGPPSLCHRCPWWGKLLALLIIVAGIVLAIYFHVNPNDLTALVDPPGYQSDGIPAFPGAEGHGSDTPGGRYGPVVRVTNTQASGTGSLQWAVDQPGARYVSFLVAGSISGDIIIKHGSLTIAGHTAPGYGITLKGSILLSTQTAVSLDDVVIQFIRVRPPTTTSGHVRPSPAIVPATLANYQTHAFLAYYVTNVIIDHCTFSSSADSLVHLVRTRNITISWSTFEEPQAGTSTDPDPLPLPTRPSASASSSAAIVKAGLYEDDTETSGVIHSATLTSVNVTHASFHHNLVVHSSRASPQFDGSPVDIRNNVFHDYNQGMTHQAMLGRTLVDPLVTGGINIVGNWYQDRLYQGAGVPPLNDSITNDPDLAQYYAAIYDGAGPAIPWVLAGTDYQYHIKDNQVDGIGFISDPWTTWNSWSAADMIKYSRWGIDYATELGTFAPEPFSLVNAPVTTNTPAQAYSSVLLEAGSQPRDAQSQRVVLETRKKSGWIGRTMTVPDKATMNSTLVDSDSDGIPDDWEIVMGADPYNFSDATVLWNNTGYTLFELYAHSVADGLLDTARSTSTNITTRYTLTLVYGRSASTTSANDTEEKAAEGYREWIDGQVLISEGRYHEGARIDITAISMNSEQQAFLQWIGYGSVRRTDLPQTFLLMPAQNITVTAVFVA